VSKAKQATQEKKQVREATASSLGSFCWCLLCSCLLCVAGVIASMLVPRTKVGDWTTGSCRLRSWTKCTTRGLEASSARVTREADDQITHPSSCASSKSDPKKSKARDCSPSIVIFAYKTASFCHSTLSRLMRHACRVAIAWRTTVGRKSCSNFLMRMYDS
jgi:hypothetical protein